MFEAGIVMQFEAAHRLHGEFGPAARSHGHTYRVEIGVRGSSLQADGTLFDISVLQNAAGEIVRALNYRDLDDLAGFEGRNTTAEVVAQYVGEQIAPGLRGHRLTSLSVRVWESPLAYGGYETNVE